MQVAVDCVNRAVTAAITQNQFDALVDFCFNVGCGSLLNSTLLRKVNAADFAGAAAQFALWVHAGGEVVVAGTPEEVAACKASHTGRFLKVHLGI